MYHNGKICMIAVLAEGQAGKLIFFAIYTYNVTSYMYLGQAV